MNYKSIPDVIRDRAEKYSEKAVFRFFEKQSGSIRSISWNEFLIDFTKLSRVLHAQNYGYNDNIGIFAPNSPKWTVTDLAILNIRAVVVPFFTTASKEQCKYIVDETKMKLIFVGEQDQYEKALWLLDNTETLIQVVVFNDAIEIEDARCIGFGEYINTAVAEMNIENVEDAAELTDLATIIYTSGTTGDPKGVMLTNENFIHAFSIHEKRLDLNENDVSLCFLPLSHVFERTWTYYLLYCGGTNFYLENPKEVIDILPLAKPTVMCTVPRFFEKTLEGIQSEAEKWPAIKKRIFNWSVKTGSKVSNLKKKDAPIPSMLQLQYRLADKMVLRRLCLIFGGNMRMMPCSGAALPIHLLKFFHATGIFVNYGYGATETTATVSCFKTNQYEFESCGTIMPDVEVKISGENEIWVKGKTVFSGYYKKPEETLKVLENGWYKTGDEGQITADGNLLMTDRLKDLMKTSLGKYISPQKLETLLGQDPMIEQVFIIGDNRKYVTALIVPVAERLHAVAEELEIKFQDIKDLVKHHMIRDFIKERINALQNELSHHEKVQDFVLICEPFSIENNMLTSTLKTRRKIIAERYASLIDGMY